ncbi:hypothetical protein DFH27DRAFT_558715 [Peziza echinospora]|nr:hypothetical protein DFH27DRAFT_558715 [Peziza echinospora]
MCVVLGGENVVHKLGCTSYKFLLFLCCHPSPMCASACTTYLPFISFFSLSVLEYHIIVVALSLFRIPLFASHTFPCLFAFRSPTYLKYVLCTPIFLFGARWSSLFLFFLFSLPFFFLFFFFFVGMGQMCRIRSWGVAGCCRMSCAGTYLFKY